MTTRKDTTITESPWTPPREPLGCCVDRPYGKGCTTDTCMHLPVIGQTCADCKHVRRCTTMFGQDPADHTCQFFPRRFEAAEARVFDVGPGFVRAKECPACGHTRCGDDCNCDCAAAHAKAEERAAP